jgi:hypothetical protein
MEPHPLFKAFIGAAYQNRRRRLAQAGEESREEAAYSRGN